MNCILKVILSLLIFSGLAFSQNISTEHYIDRATTIMTGSSDLENYIEKNYAQKTLSDTKLSDYKRQLLTQYAELSSIEAELNLQLRRVNDSLMYSNFDFTI